MRHRLEDLLNIRLRPQDEPNFVNDRLVPFPRIGGVHRAPGLVEVLEAALRVVKMRNSLVEGKHALPAAQRLLQALVVAREYLLELIE